MLKYHNIKSEYQENDGQKQCIFGPAQRPHVVPLSTNLEHMTCATLSANRGPSSPLPLSQFFRSTVSFRLHVLQSLYAVVQNL